jgi:CubicO group peptidase (beta-lactamase class C family)
VWNGERILPDGYVWAADHQPVYGAFFWLNGAGSFPVRREAYYMAGAGGQFAIVIPSHDLVVVRLGHYRGGEADVGQLGWCRRA